MRFLRSPTVKAGEATFEGQNYWRVDRSSWPMGQQRAVSRGSLIVQWASARGRICQSSGYCLSSPFFDSSIKMSLGPLNKYIYLRFYLFIFRERGREGERPGEKHQLVRKESR